MPNTLDYLLRYHQQYDDFEINHYVKNTLTKMAYGGIYDQIGGGFLDILLTINGVFNILKKCSTIMHNS